MTLWEENLFPRGNRLQSDTQDKILSPSPGISFTQKEIPIFMSFIPSSSDYSLLLERDVQGDISSYILTLLSGISLSLLRYIVGIGRGVLEVPER